MSASKNSTLLLDFVEYCLAHPEERFWQALRNWSGYLFIYASNDPSDAQYDTFYMEKRNHID